MPIIGKAVSFSDKHSAISSNREVTSLLRISAISINYNGSLKEVKRHFKVLLAGHRSSFPSHRKHY